MTRDTVRRRLPCQDKTWQGMPNFCKYLGLQDGSTARAIYGSCMESLRKGQVAFPTIRLQFLYANTSETTAYCEDLGCLSAEDGTHSFVPTPLMRKATYSAKLTKLLGKTDPVNQLKNRLRKQVFHSAAGSRKHCVEAG